MAHRLTARIAGLISCLVILSFGAPLAAQQGSAVDVIVGTVTDSLGRPVTGATVEAYSIESQVTRRTTTNARGRYTIFFNDGGGQYRVQITMIGKQPFIANVSRQGDDDRIMLDVKMGDRPVVLQEIVARGSNAPLGGRDAPTPGSTERNFSAEQALRLPIDASDLAALAALVPGVIVTAGTDSTAAQFSIAGQGGLANNYTVDGISFGGSGLPQDAIRNTRVITSTFDVARGQFSGGLVSASTRGGSNAVQGSLSGNLRDYHLAFGGTDDVFSRGQTQQRLGFGFGGPIVRDKFFAFGSFQVDRSLAPIATLGAASAATSGRLGISQDSVNRFISLVDATGLTARAGAIDPNRTTDGYTGLARFDLNISDRHSFTVRGDLRLNTSDPTRIGATQLAQVGGDTEGSGGGLAVSLSSRLGSSITNEFRAGWSSDESTATPYLVAPSGRVQNLSDLSDGSRSSTVLGFGGNSGLPQHSINRGLEITNEISLFSPSATHRYRLGVLYSAQSFEQDVTTNRSGTYTYNSLTDFENNTPSQFTRTLSPTIRDGSSTNMAVYLSDVWRMGNLQLTLGGRLERSAFGGAPGRNTAVESAFGVRTDVLPSETAFTPRLGFSWNIPSAEQRGQAQRGFAPPLLTIRGGVGLFRGTMSSTLPGTAQAQSGLLNTESQLFCVGGATPIPDWDAIAANAALIPDECLGGVSQPITTGIPSITTYEAGYGAAKTWRGSLGASKRFWDTWSLNVDASYTRGVGQSASRDLNLVGAPVFTLDDGRPVYADPSAIVTTSGAVPLSASRINNEFGRVNQVFSALENSTTQFTASVSTFLRRGATLNLSYSWMRSRDQGGSGGGGGFGGRGGGGFTGGGSTLTAGDPNTYLWGVAGSDRTHNIQFNVTWPFTQSLEVTAIGRTTSGTPYSPIVSGDINGDGSRNDLAYVYDPATATDPAIAASMERLLGSLSGSARDCLVNQMGRIAERNSCRGPWQPSLDLQVNWRPGMFDNRLAISFATSNLLGGLDELFHGDELKGWGGFARPDGTLLTVTGFDASTNQFEYVVNERFGATGAGATAVRSPFQVGVQMRYTIGQDRLRDIRRNFFGGGASQPNLAQQMLGRIDSLAPHPARSALLLKDKIALDSRQVAALQSLVDSADAKMKPLVDTMRVVIEKAGTNPDLQQIFPLMQPIMMQIRANNTTGLAAVQQILTPVQWALLPETVRTPSTQGNPFLGGLGAPGGQPGQGRPGGGPPQGGDRQRGRP